VRGAGPDQRAALVGAGAVADGVPQADPLVDRLVIERPENHLEGFDVGVCVREDPDPHPENPNGYLNT
jgi:hypothetical protein